MVVVREKSNFILLPMNIQFFLAPITEETVLSPLSILDFLVSWLYMYVFISRLSVCFIGYYVCFHDNNMLLLFIIIIL